MRLADFVLTAPCFLDGARAKEQDDEGKHKEGRDRNEFHLEGLRVSSGQDPEVVEVVVFV